MVREPGYDAFISYSHAVSGRLATVLQGWLERFATPWYRPRGLRIFRDYTSLVARRSGRSTCRVPPTGTPAPDEK